MFIINYLDLPVTNTVMFILTQQTIELAPQHLLQSPNDHLWEEVETLFPKIVTWIEKEFGGKNYLLRIQRRVSVSGGKTSREHICVQSKSNLKSLSSSLNFKVDFPLSLSREIFVFYKKKYNIVQITC